MTRDDSRPWLASYSPETPATYDFPSVPLTRLLDDAVASFPETPALAFIGTVLTFRDLQESVDRFGAALTSLGVQSGDRVALALPNCPQQVIGFYACARIGAVVVNCNPLYTARELAHQLSDSGAVVIVCLDMAYAKVAEIRSETALRHVVVASIVDYLPKSKQLLLHLPLPSVRKRRASITGTVPGGAQVLRFPELLRGETKRAPQADFDPSEHLAALQYTGGTTGVAKGAMLTHANLVANAYQCRLWVPEARVGVEPVLAVVPMFHAYGMTACMNLAMTLMSTLVVLPRFDIAMTFAAIDKWRPTIFMGVPPMYKALTDSPDVGKHDLRSIRYCISGAMKLTREVQEGFESISGGHVVEGFGMSECSPVTHANPVDGRDRIGSIGLPLTGTDARIVDPEDPLRLVAAGDRGELLIRGPQVMKGYWNRPDETAAAFVDGEWLRTGDITVMDADGYFSVVDRIKELIITGGFNVYPTEVEDTIRRVPGVADVSVVGVPDGEFGETVKAFVVRAPGATLAEEDILAHCRRELTKYKVPRLIEFRDDLPRSIIGKVLRRVLVDEERAKVAGPVATPSEGSS
ncbi:MAG: AMP-dependent synthetase and ligase [Frankiales bacterium]|nr:AMP-dependent synthetase and ligase [Frankiales bacterium]